MQVVAIGEVYKEQIRELSELHQLIFKHDEMMAECLIKGEMVMKQIENRLQKPREKFDVVETMGAYNLINTSLQSILEKYGVS